MLGIQVYKKDYDDYDNNDDNNYLQNLHLSTNLFTDSSNLPAFSTLHDSYSLRSTLIG